ncbi:hypothetical protein HNR60_000606 [Rhodopseudomonas rhenobacensis]|uniref:Uncharacterized protein n=1 Tax=Rhodopseudomonas rhenobacensis TaxID=87461 RepID=A0A7W7Z0W0_9BRAD|nr:hypothetical protein [Rhodopseudomonas rhenobacensis]MBB5045871.1 hypothetical protein [Rhodopseudomonas rhenobacensis]
MALYRVQFFKDILGDNGHHAEVCQHLLEVEAANSCDAGELAKLKFCETEHLTDWSLRADRLRVSESECPATRHTAH